MLMSTTRFVTYVLDFYGPEGIYADFFPGSTVSEADVRDALSHLLELRKKHNTPFDGDSFDREHLRDIMLVRKGICSASETEYNTEL